MTWRLPDKQCVAMLHMNGGDASNVFVDEAGKAWTANGNAQIDTAQSVFGGASALFDGAGDYISTPNHADWRLDGGADANEWTIDLRVRFNGDPGTGTCSFMGQFENANNYWGFDLINNNIRFFVISVGSPIVNVQNAWNPADATWYHIALVKQGVTGYKVFVDGTQVGSTQTDTSVIPVLNGSLYIGQTGDGLNMMNGWLDEVRVSKGVARWTANFTPPTVAYKASFKPLAHIISR